MNADRCERSAIVAPMFKPTDRQQNLFGSGQLGAGAKRRLESSWAETFRLEVYPLLLEAESEFQELYGKTGRPNFSVARVLGIVLLQELRGLADQEALDAYSFDARWQHALDAADQEAYLSRRSLVEFRRRLVEQDAEMDLIRKVFEKITEGALDRFQTSVKEQRLDSTHVLSNIRKASVLDLFDSIVRKFLQSLTARQYSQAPRAAQRWFEEETSGHFGFSQSERNAKAHEIAVIAVSLLARFKKNSEVSQKEPYQLVQRLVDDWCDVEKKRIPSKKKKNGGKRYKTVVFVNTRKKGCKINSAHDPDASHGHKGVGYSAQITETCNNEDKPEFITDYEVTGANQSDVGMAAPVVERLEENGRKPETLYADAGYPTPGQLVDLEAKGVELFAPVHRGPMDSSVMGRDRFRFNETGEVFRCPRGCKPIDHRVQNPNGNGVELHAYFEGAKCRACPMLDRCPVRAPNHRDKGTSAQDTVGNFRLAIGPALRARDQRLVEQKTEEWRDRYAIRAGIEATNSELKRAHGFGRLRVRKKAQVIFALASKLIACNIKRWLRAGQALPAALQALCWLTVLACLVRAEPRHQCLKFVTEPS